MRLLSDENFNGDIVRGLARCTRSNPLRLPYAAACIVTLCLAPSPAWSADHDGPGAADDAEARIAAFLADRDGSKRTDAPCWGRFRTAIGDGEDARPLFAGILRAEGGLFVTAAAEPERLSEVLSKRVADLEAFSRTRGGTTYDGGKIVGSNITFGSLAAVLLLAADPAVTTDYQTDRGLSEITRHVIHLDFRGTFRQGSPRLRAVKRLVAAWIVREGDPRSLGLKYGLATRAFHRDRLDETHWSLALQYLRARGRAPRGGRPWGDSWEGELFGFALAMARIQGDAEQIPLLAPFLEDASLIGFSYTKGGTRVDKVEARDAALAAVVRLSGRDPADYCFERTHAEDPRDETYFFLDPADRNRAFARCRRDFKLLGLDRPPRYEPEPEPPPERFAFEPGDTSGAPREDPTGKVRIEASDATALLKDAATGKPIGGPLLVQHPWASENTMRIICWAFSPDGTLVATGAGYRLPQRSGDINVGRIRVWEAATGTLVATDRSRIGSVRGVAFAKGGKTIYFQADPYLIDGP